MRTIGLLVLLGVVSAAEPWLPVPAPRISNREDAMALVRLAYRSVAEQPQQHSFAHSAVEVACIGGELVVRCNDVTYRVTLTNTLTEWPISAEESAQVASTEEQQRAAWAVCATQFTDLPLIPSVTVEHEKDGDWSIRWKQMKKIGRGIQIGSDGNHVQPFSWCAGGGHRCGGSRQIPVAPSGGG